MDEKARHNSFMGKSAIVSLVVLYQHKYWGLFPYFIQSEDLIIEFGFKTTFQMTPRLGMYDVMTKVNLQARKNVCYTKHVSVWPIVESKICACQTQWQVTF